MTRIYRHALVNTDIQKVSDDEMNDKIYFYGEIVRS